MNTEYYDPGRRLLACVGVVFYSRVVLCPSVSHEIAPESTKKSRDLSPFHHFVDFLFGKEASGERASDAVYFP